MNQTRQNLLQGIMSLFLIIPLPTLIIQAYSSIQTTGELVIFNQVFSGTSSTMVLGYLILLTFYLLYKTIKSLSHFLLSM